MKKKKPKSSHGSWILQWCEAQKHFHIEQGPTQWTGRMSRFARGESEAEPWATFGLYETAEEAEKMLAELAKLRGLKFCKESCVWKDTKYLGTDGIGVGMLSKSAACPARSRKPA